MLRIKLVSATPSSVSTHAVKILGISVKSKKNTYYQNKVMLNLHVHSMCGYIILSSLAAHFHNQFRPDSITAYIHVGVLCPQGVNCGLLWPQWIT